MGVLAVTEEVARPRMATPTATEQQKRAANDLICHTNYCVQSRLFMFVCCVCVDTQTYVELGFTGLTKTLLSLVVVWPIQYHTVLFGNHGYDNK
jgi:hypothetical protein